MADSSSDLLQQAQEIQRQKLLEQAQSIQQAKLNPVKPETPKAWNSVTAEGSNKAMANAAPEAGVLAGQEIGAPLGPIGQVLGGGLGKTAVSAAQTAAEDYSKGGLSEVFRPPTVEGTVEGFKMAGQNVLDSANQYMGGKIISGAMDKGAEALNSLAETKAFKAAGAMLKDFRSAFNKNPDKINELGRTMLDNGLVKAGDSVKSVAQKSEVLRRETGEEIGKVYDKVLESLTDPTSQVPHDVVLNIQGAGFHPELQADEMKAIVAQGLKGRPGSTAAINKAHTVIDEIALNGNNITPQHALELKGGVDSMINWSKKSQDLPLDQDALKIVRNYIQNRLTGQVQMMDQALGSSQTKELLQLNQLYGNVSTIANVAKDRVLRENANQSFGLTDKIVGTGGLGVGASIAHHLGLDPVSALALSTAAGATAGVANKAARTYGNAAVAQGANALSAGLQAGSSYGPAMSTIIRPFVGKKGGVSSKTEAIPAQQQLSDRND